MAKSKKLESQAAELYSSGLAIDSVAAELGVCYRTARKAIRNGGVQLRDPSSRLRGRTKPNKTQGKK
jgi:orotate phosphoribosyltransferase-like protein